MDLKARKAFEILARENSRMLIVYLRSLVQDEAAIDDLFQETMVVAWRRLDECDLDRPFGPWLRGIASRLVMAHYRKKKTEPVLLKESVLSLLEERFETIAGRAGDTWDEKIAALHECLDALPDKHRGAVQARYIDELPANQAAERLQVSLEAFKKRIQRTRTMLADCLKRKGVMIAGETT